MSATSLESVRSVPLWLLMLPPVAVGYGYGAVLPVLPGWIDALHRQSAEPPVAWHAGLLGAAYLAGAVLGAPLWGGLSDWIGRRPVLAIGLGGSILTLVLLWPAMSSLPLLYATRFLNGLFAAAALPVTLAYAAERFAIGERGKTLAWINGGAVLGFLAGPAVSAGLHALAGAPLGRSAEAAHGMPIPLVSAALVGSIILGIVWRWLPRTASRVGRPDVRTGDRPTGGTALFSILILTGFGALGLGVLEVGLTLFGLRGWGLSAGRIAIFYTVCSVAMVTTQMLAFAPLSRHLDDRWIAAAALAGMAAGLLLLTPAVGHYGFALLAVAMIASSAGLLTPALSQLATRSTQAQVGAWVGWQNSAGNLGQAAGSVLGGLLFGLLAATTFASMGALLGVAALFAAALAARRGAADSIPKHDRG